MFHRLLLAESFVELVRRFCGALLSLTSRNPPIGESADPSRSDAKTSLESARVERLIQGVSSRPIESDRHALQIDKYRTILCEG